MEGVHRLFRRQRALVSLWLRPRASPAMSRGHSKKAARRRTHERDVTSSATVVPVEALNIDGPKKVVGPLQRSAHVYYFGAKCNANSAATDRAAQGGPARVAPARRPHWDDLSAHTTDVTGQRDTDYRKRPAPIVIDFTNHHRIPFVHGCDSCGHACCVALTWLVLSDPVPHKPDKHSS